jgi:cobalamin-dependent methionine synthase I
VLDASRSVTVVTNLLNKESRTGQLLEQTKKEYEALRQQFLNKQKHKVLIPYRSSRYQRIFRLEKLPAGKASSRRRYCFEILRPGKDCPIH